MHRLANVNFAESSFVRTTFAATIPHDTPYEAIFDPMFWSNMARKMKIGDKIEVFAEDGSYYAELIVIAYAPQWVKVKETLPKVSLVDDIEAPEEVSGYEVKWRGPNGRWAVIKLPSTVLFANGQTKEDAENWLKEHKKTILS